MRRKNSKDIIDQVAETGLDISGHIYEVPAAVFSEGLSTALELKDAVKHQVGLNPCKQNGQRVLLYRTLSNGRWAYNRTLNPTQENEWARFVRLAKQQPNRYRLVRPVKGRRRNPAEGSDDMYESFHGAPPSQDVIVEKDFHEHAHLAGLGDLVECWIETPTGLLVQIQFPERDRPILSSNEHGTQLYIEGGDQKVDLAKLEMNSADWVKDRMVLGCFALPNGKRKHNISYFTSKDFDDFEPIIYEHDLGEPDEGEPKSARRESPYLEYEPQNVQLYVTGGQYQIKRPLFETSPGIEN